MSAQTAHHLAMNKQAYIAFCFVSIALGQPNRLNNLGAHLYETGDYAKAEPLYRQAIAEWRALDEPGPLGVTLSNLATLYRKTGRYTEAIKTFSEAEQQIRAAHGPNSQEMVRCLVNWSDAYRVSGRLAEAEDTAARALAISENAHTLHAYAAALQSSGRVGEAIRLHERALALGETAATLNALASAYLETGRYAEAEPLASRALAIWEAKLGPDHLNTAIAMNNMAQVHRFLNRGFEAEPLYRRSIEILLKHKSPDAAKPLTNLADFYLSRGRNMAALALYKQAEEINPTEAARLKVAKAYEAMGRNTEAARVYRQVARR
jgi:tetratricopeptide (TPR) repeat protein